jgi:hypothetical protein
MFLVIFIPRFECAGFVIGVNKKRQ